jgi:hypothetical protein
LFGLSLILGFFGDDTNWLLLAAAIPATSFACDGIGMLTGAFSPDSGQLRSDDELRDLPRLLLERRAFIRCRLCRQF